MPADKVERTAWDRHLLMAMFIAGAVLIFRGALIAHYHGPTADENYHLYRGLIFLRQDWTRLETTRLNDPPFGEALSAIPAWLNGVHMPNTMYASSWARSKPPPAKFCYVMPEAIRVETAIWKSILFLPAIGVVFQWIRSVYSTTSAWLATALLLIEPTFAAHIPLPTVDGLGAEGIVISAWTAWRFAVKPTTGRQWAAAVTMALAMVLKHTALLLPIAALAMAAFVWFCRRPSPGDRWPIAKKWMIGAALVPFLIWMFLCFHVSVPSDFADWWLFGKSGLASGGIPGGIYLESIWEGFIHVRTGHENYLLGQASRMGWWYYFLVVATYKIPIGIGVVMALGLVSFLWSRPRFDETPLIICALLWTGAGMAQHINIGFRHFLPAEIFWLMIASRVIVSRGKVFPVIVWLSIAWAAIDTARWSPDFLSYVNFPRPFVYLDISDSNIDWGQALPEVRRWIESRPDDGRPIYLGYAGPFEQNLFQQVGPRLKGYTMADVNWIFSNPDSPDFNPAAMPTHGILILSPILITGQMGDPHRFDRFRRIPASEVVGHCMLVYDLDRLDREYREDRR